MAHKKAGGSSRNGRDSNSQRLGIKRYGGEIVEQGRGEKVIAFKKKRRKNTHRKRGHRQHFTKIKITEIQAS